MMRAFGQVLHRLGLVAAIALAGAPLLLAAGEEPPPATPPELTATYSNLADIILGARKAEEALVRSIIGTTYGHAQARVSAARQAAKAGNAAQAQSNLEAAASLVGQIATEGDTAVAGVRKRLLEGGHHHNAAGEQQGLYDEGYVVVTKAQKTALLNSSKAFGMMAKSATDDAIAKEWAKVQTVYDSMKK